MLNRRRVVQGGLAAAGSLTASAPFGARAQSKPPVKIRYNEVVRAILYAPAYVAITNGYFKDAARLLRRSRRLTLAMNEAAGKAATTSATAWAVRSVPDRCRGWNRSHSSAPPKKSTWPMPSSWKNGPDWVRNTRVARSMPSS